MPWVSEFNPSGICTLAIHPTPDGTGAIGPNYFPHYLLLIIGQLVLINQKINILHRCVLNVAPGGQVG